MIQNCTKCQLTYILTSQDFSWLQNGQLNCVSSGWIALRFGGGLFFAFLRPIFRFRRDQILFDWILFDIVYFENNNLSLFPMEFSTDMLYLWSKNFKFPFYRQKIVIDRRRNANKCLTRSTELSNQLT